MANVGNDYISFSIKELVVFKVGCHQHIRTLPTGIIQQKTTGTTANGYFLDFSIQKLRMPDNLRSHSFFQIQKKIAAIHGFRQTTDKP